MPTNLQNLDRLQAIVDQLGIPTQYFIRFIQNRGGALTDLEALILELQAIIDAFSGNEIIAGDVLSGGGLLANGDVTLDHDTALVSPGIYGSGTMVPQITVDEFGHIQLVTEVPVSGGGGGGSPWWLQPPTAASLSTLSGGTGVLTMADDADEGLLWSAGAPGAAGDTLRLMYRTLTSPTLDWTLVFRATMNWPQNQWTGLGPFYGDSVSGRFVMMENRQDEACLIAQWLNTANRNSFGAQSNIYRRDIFWWKLEKVGTTATWYWSVNGKNWMIWQGGTTNVTSFFSGVHPDRVGVSVQYINRNTGPAVFGSIGYFSLTGPAV